MTGYLFPINGLLIILQTPLEPMIVNPNCYSYTVTYFSLIPQCRHWLHWLPFSCPLTLHWTPIDYPIKDPITTNDL